MAVRFDAAADRLLRTTNLPTGAFTISFWVYLVSDLNAYSNFFYIGGDNYGGTYFYVGTAADGTTLLLGHPTEISGSALSVNTWYYVAATFLTGASNRAFVYLGSLTSLAAQDIQSGLNPGQPTTTRMEFGAVGTGNNDRGNIRIANIKLWTAQKPLAEVQAEQFSIRPVDFTNLAGWWPCFPGSGERARDYSGLARDWTEGGTLTDEDPPPVSYGTNSYYVNFVASGGSNFNQPLSSDMGMSSAIIKNTTRPLASAIGSSTDLLRNTGKSLSSVIGSTSTIIKGTARAFTSSLPMSSALIASKTVLQLLTSSMGMNSALVRQTQKVLTSQISPSAVIAKTLPTKVLSSILTFNSGYGLQFFGGGNSDTVDKVYIVCNPSDTINVGQSDFTIEFRLRAPASLQDGTATAGANYSWINSPIIVDRDLIGSVGSGGDWGISMTDGRITFGLENSAGSQRTIIGTTDLRDDRWHHVAVTRNRTNGDMAVYVDGVREAVQTSGPSGDVHIASNSGSSTWNRYICLGGEKHALDWPQGQWIGYLDELRISTNLRYTGTSYTVPSGRFTSDANTVALYHMDEGTGTTLIDTTGNANGTLNVGGVSNGPQYQDSNWVTSVFASFTKILSSAITPTSSLIKGTTKSLTASINSSANIIKNTFKAFTSSIDLTTALVATKTFFVQLTSQLNLSSTLLKSTTKSLLSSITPITDIIKSTFRSLASSMGISSTLDSLKTIFKTLESSISMSSSLNNLTTKQISGIINMGTNLTKSTTRELISSFGLSSTLNKNTTKLFISSIGFVGDFTKTATKVLIANITPSSSISKSIFKVLTSAINFVGQLINDSIVITEKGTVDIYDSNKDTVDVYDLNV